MTTEKRLAEREKELACIYSICLLAAGAPEPEAVAEGMARALRAAMQREDLAYCVVEFRHAASGRMVRVCRGVEESPPPTPGILPSGTFTPPAEDTSEPLCRTIEAFLPADATAGGWSGSIRLDYRGDSALFLPQEKALLDSVLIVAASILRTSSLIEDLRSTSSNLAAKNIALREVLSVIEEERRNSLMTFRKRLATEILPLAERARDALLTEERRRSYLDLLIDEIARDITAFGSDPAADHSLSPREREVAVQVRNGRTSKEIAELLGIAEATVERHRHNIRKKFRIANKSVNLAGLLSNEDSAGADPGQTDL
jgi:DNA-binding CsgD family transcriptional regulator